MLIPREFFARPSVEVAPALLGCVLEHEAADGLVAVELTEVEAYAGRSDPASHAYRGKTRRNAVMFGPPGHAYVYFTYGMHFCVNVVCLGEEGSASAVLLRAGAIVAGEDLARARRTRGPASAGPISQSPVSAGRASAGPVSESPVSESPVSESPVSESRASLAARDLARGPARLCQALGIDRSLDGADVCVAQSPLRVYAGAGYPARSGTAPARGDDPPRPPRKILTGPRVGVSSAAEIPWRFWYEGDPTVSVYRPHVPRRPKLVTP